MIVFEVKQSGTLSKGHMSSTMEDFRILQFFKVMRIPRKPNKILEDYGNLL